MLKTNPPFNYILMKIHFLHNLTLIIQLQIHRMSLRSLRLNLIGRKYMYTRGPWTAPACPDEIVLSFLIFCKLIIFWEIAYSKAVISLNGCKNTFYFPSIILLGGIGTKWNPITLIHKDPLYLPRYHLQGLIQQIRS